MSTVALPKKEWHRRVAMLARAATGITPGQAQLDWDSAFGYEEFPDNPQEGFYLWIDTMNNFEGAWDDLEYERVLDIADRAFERFEREGWPK